MRIDKNTKIYLGQREIVKIKKGNIVIWEATPQDDTDYFYIENTYAGSNTLSIVKGTSGTVPSDTYATSIEYSKDKSTWTSIDITGNTQTISMDEGDTVYFRNNSGKFSTHTSNDSTLCYSFRNTQSCNAGGNILTLVDYTDLDKYTVPDGCFESLFNSNTGLVDCSNLKLTPVVMPFRALSGAFWGCSALTVAPELSATIVGEKCYQNAFRECTSLVNGPVMRAFRLGDHACQQMFLNSSSLKNFTVYVNDYVRNATTNWLKGVSSDGTLYNYGKATYTSSSISGIPSNWSESIQKDYFYIENTSGGNNTLSITPSITGSPSSSYYTTTLEYSKDKANWTTINLVAGTTSTISMSDGEKVYFRNDNGKLNYWSSSDQYSTRISASGTHNAGGNINTIVNYTSPYTVTVNNGCYLSLFQSDSNLVDASHLVLPQSLLSTQCYRSTFNNCTGLKYPPYLGATLLADSCYRYMFSSCSSLKEAPLLYLESLEANCYNFMFRDCTSLTTAPALPATSLAANCYDRMFQGCTTLTSSPVLSATTLVKYCYNQMFKDCSSLNEVTTYADNISASNCLTGWLDGVAATGTFHNLGSATYTTGTSGIPSGWTEVNS